MTTERDPYTGGDPFTMVGAKLLIRSNEDEPTLVGELIGWEELKANRIPIVLLESGETVMPMGVLLPYDDKLLALFQSMNHKDAWNLACRISITNQIAKRMSRKG